MLDLANPLDYFRELRELSGDAEQFIWNTGAGNKLAELADELKNILELSGKRKREAEFEYFLREMLAECSPDNAAYYVSSVCSQESSICKHAWFAYSALRAIELDYKPAGATQAALTVCAAMSVACKKTLACCTPNRQTKPCRRLHRLLQPIRGRFCWQR